MIARQPAEITMFRTPLLFYVLFIFQWIFSGGNAERVSDSDLKNFTEFLLTVDHNNAGQYLRMDPQLRNDYNRPDLASQKPLFTVAPAVHRIKTFNLVMDIFNKGDSYGTQEDDTQAEGWFLDAVVNTDIMRRTKAFLESSGAFKGSMEQFKAVLRRLWFTVYKRGKLVSSGFKHVFMAEVKRKWVDNVAVEIVNGLHNWYFFALEEQKGIVKYLSWKKYRYFNSAKKGGIITVRFRWRNRMKESGSMLFGTSPELEMALYTVCFLARPEEVCKVAMGGVDFTVNTYPHTVNNVVTVGTAFPSL